MSSIPVISIIMPVFNSVKTLEDAIRSVIKKKPKEIELILIDGNSNDGSIEIIKKYSADIDFFVTEPDSGVYEAMNKGIDASKGEWIYFLGSDDSLSPGIVESIIKYLLPPYKIVFGDVRFSNGRLVRSFLGPRILMHNTVHHQGTFYHRSLFQDFRYDEYLKIQADYELNLLIYLRKIPFLYVPITIANYSIDGISAGPTMKSLKEINIIRSRHLNSKIQISLFSIILYAYYLQKQIRFWLHYYK